MLPFSHRDTDLDETLEIYFNFIGQFIPPIPEEEIREEAEKQAAIQAEKNRIRAEKRSISLLLAVSACGKADSGNIQAESTSEQSGIAMAQESLTKQESEDRVQASSVQAPENAEIPSIVAGERATEKSIYTDANGDTAYIPVQFMVSENEDEQAINTGLVVIGPDGSEFVWIPTTKTELSVRDFGSYFFGGDISDYYDETDLTEYQEMVASVERYGGFYMGRFEASRSDEGLPASKRVTDSKPGQIWV